MPHFDIEKKSDIDKTFRVAKIISDFDVKIEHSNERFVGDLNLPKKWQIGCIVGASGTGKSTIANKIFKNHIVKNFNYNSKSVIDDMPKKSMQEIEKMFYSVGFGSVPSWLKPYDVLSNGEKMRVDLARAMLENDFVVFDEFTSVVDRNVAQTACIAINKFLKNNSDKKFVAVSCHYDILEFLQPDWIFDTNEMKTFFGISHEHKKYLKSKNVNVANGKNLGVIII